MNNKAKVRRKVITPHGEYIGMWREQETYGYIDLAISDHPQCPVEKIKIDKGRIQNKVLSIELYTPDGGHIYIPSSIVEKSIVICEFETLERAYLCDIEKTDEIDHFAENAGMIDPDPYRSSMKLK